MGQENFEGDLNQISPRQLEYISEVLNNLGFKNVKVTIKAVGEVGDNYAANVKRIIVDNNEEIFKIVVKVASKIEQFRMTMNTITIFHNEHVMYTEVLPKFTELEKAAGIPTEERLRYATCYGTLMEDLEELILLEDLTESGFTMLDRFKSLTDNEIKLVLKSFAKLHSLSYALKYQEPDTYKDLTSKIDDFFQMFPMEMFHILEVIEQDTIAICDPKYTKYITGNLSGMLEKGKELSQLDTHSRFSVLQQGDAWTNNVLFKLQESKSVSCCMIDYQLSRVNSPVADILYMLFNCTDHETRKQHYLDWMDYYHFELENHLHNFDLEANYVYPRDQLDADLKNRIKQSIGLAIFSAFTLTREGAQAQELKDVMENTSPENMADMTELAKPSNLGKKTVLLFKNKVEGIIETCLEFGLL